MHYVQKKCRLHHGYVKTVPDTEDSSHLSIVLVYLLLYNIDKILGSENFKHLMYNLSAFADAYRTDTLKPFLDQVPR